MERTFSCSPRGYLQYYEWTILKKKCNPKLSNSSECIGKMSHFYLLKNKRENTECWGMLVKKPQISFYSKNIARKMILLPKSTKPLIFRPYRGLHTSLWLIFNIMSGLTLLWHLISPLVIRCLPSFDSPVYDVGFQIWLKT